MHIKTHLSLKVVYNKKQLTDRLWVQRLVCQEAILGVLLDLESPSLLMYSHKMYSQPRMRWVTHYIHNNMFSVQLSVS